MRHKFFFFLVFTSLLASSVAFASTYQQLKEEDSRLGRHLIMVGAAETIKMPIMIKVPEDQYLAAKRIYAFRKEHFEKYSPGQDPSVLTTSERKAIFAWLSESQRTFLRTVFDLVARYGRKSRDHAGSPSSFLCVKPIPDLFEAGGNKKHPGYLYAGNEPLSQMVQAGGNNLLALDTGERNLPGLMGNMDNFSSPLSATHGGNENSLLSWLPSPFIPAMEQFAFSPSTAVASFIMLPYETGIEKFSTPSVSGVQASESLEPDLQFRQFRVSASLPAEILQIVLLILYASLILALSHVDLASYTLGRIEKSIIYQSICQDIHDLYGALQTFIEPVLNRFLPRRVFVQ